MAYGVVRTDLMTGTDVRSELVSVRFKASNNAAAIENGNVVKLVHLRQAHARYTLEQLLLQTQQSKMLFSLLA